MTGMPHSDERGMGPDEAHDSGVGSGPADDSERAPDDDPADGRLILVGTPIGNLGDASPRMRQTIEAADVIAAEGLEYRYLLDLADLGL